MYGAYTSIVPLHSSVVNMQQYLFNLLSSLFGLLMGFEAVAIFPRLAIYSAKSRPGYRLYIPLHGNIPIRFFCFLLPPLRFSGGSRKTLLPIKTTSLFFGV